MGVASAAQSSRSNAGEARPLSGVQGHESHACGELAAGG